jgi:hypothetical protein
VHREGAKRIIVMTYILEIYYQGDCIEHREQPAAFMAPNIGEQIHITFENQNISDAYGNWWVVRKKKYLFFGVSTKMQTLQLFCEPDPNGGV